MPPKIPTLQELLERPICYYCEKDFDDELVLKNHMRKKHLWCPNCRKQLDSAGGVSVHMMQVHKEQYKAVPNTLEGREDPNVEVIGSVGFPEHLKQELHDKIRQKYWQHAAEFKARTGNPLPGSGEVVQNKQHVETPEEIRARVAEHIARKRAEKAAAAAAAANGTASLATPPSAPDSATGSTSQHPAPILPSVPPGPAVAPPVGYNASSPINQNFGNGQWSAAHANPAYPAPGQLSWPQTSLAPSHPHMTPTVPYYTLTPSLPPNSATVAPSLPPNPSFNPGPRRPNSSHMQTPPVVGGAGASKPASMPTVPAQPLPSSLPSVPGLPQRPTFDSPNFSKEDMAKMHSGQQPAPSPFYGGAPPPPFPQAAAPNHPFASVSAPTTLPHPPHTAAYAQVAGSPPSQIAQAPVAKSLDPLTPAIPHHGAPPHQDASMRTHQTTPHEEQRPASLVNSVAPVAGDEQSAKLSDSAASTTASVSKSKKRPSPWDATEPRPAKKQQRKTVLTMYEPLDMLPEEKLAWKRGLIEISS